MLTSYIMQSQFIWYAERKDRQREENGVTKHAQQERNINAIQLYSEGNEITL